MIILCNVCVVGWLVWHRFSDTSKRVAIVSLGCCFFFFLFISFGVGSGVGKCRASRGRVGSIFGLFFGFVGGFFFVVVVVILGGFVGGGEELGCCSCCGFGLFVVVVGGGGS